MQLTRLEVKGFKSFGDKITINFDEGITSIVGPNGCGKSNVVDAIRWVLGEQSTRTLRSEKMENIIFNGTNTRKPAQLAEVSLSFNNTKNILPTEFSQVTITRKLYRSGESEYRLNDVQCRLKDITDLFLDTGIGSDSYAIIELKMVEEIINNKDHSRRALFEEASGISKYKIRKKQTITRLKDTDIDLSRVEDLLLEIEKNLKTLENQAKKTERYQRLKERYKMTSLSLTSLRMSTIQQKLKSVLEQKIIEQERRTTVQAELTQTENTLLELKQEVLIQEQHVLVQQKKLNQQLTEIQNNEMEKKIKNEQLHHFHKREQQVSKEIIQDKQQKNLFQFQIKRLQEEALDATNQMAIMEVDLAESLKEMDKAKQVQLQEKEVLNALTTQKNELQRNRNELEKQHTILTIQRDALFQESQRNQTDERNKAQELARFSENIVELQGQVLALEDQLFSVQESERITLNSIIELEYKVEQLQEKEEQNSRLLYAKQNEYSLTKSMVDNLDGFPESIRYLKKSSKWSKNAPPFSEILFCEEAYRIAIEGLLEPYMNYFVVETFHEAYAAINLLEQAGKGKAGFFVLENLPAWHGNATVPEGLVPALSVIQVEEKYALLCKHLLHAAYFQLHPEADGLPGGDLVLLEPNGKYIRKNFSIIGGSVGLFDGKRIGRSLNMDHLSMEVKKLSELQESIESEKTNEKNKLVHAKQQTQKGIIEELMAQLTRLKNETISTKTKQEQFALFIQTNLENKRSLTQQIEQLEQELKETHPRLVSMQEEQDSLDETFQKKETEFNLLTQQNSELINAYNQANLLFHQKKNNALGIAKEIEYREIQLENMESQVLEKEKEFLELQQAIHEIVQLETLSDQDLLSMHQEKKALEKGLQELEQVYYSCRGSITEFENKLKQFRNNKDISDTLITELKDQEREFFLELNALKERLRIEFSIDIESLQVQEAVEDDEYTLLDRMQTLKKQLADFGSVNPLALEAYQEINTRYEFIKGEKSDLIDARASLLKTIQEIDEIAKEKFMDAFLKVRENFKSVFRSLFNEEDTCDLIISDPENPLESDIDILARPKGKRPLSINQLSGGEKTLTSTALLFSLYLLKPAPFCIFDEIDAPLDDTNIDKFNSIIRDFSTNSQFILISHNKRTIAGTDIIYGVTMIEAGVSKVVAVDMRTSFESIINVN